MTTERKKLIERLRECRYELIPYLLMRQAADMLEADAPAVPQEPVSIDEWLANCPQSVRDLANKIKAEKIKAEMAVPQEKGYETCKAIQEGERNAAEEDYFDARPTADNTSNRHMFRSGFDRGYEAAPQQQPRLTDEEIEDFADASTGYSRMVDIKYFARAIEKKVRGEA